METRNPDRPKLHARPLVVLAKYVAGALAIAVPGLALRASGYPLHPAIGALLFAAALLAAGFMLSWSAEAGERRIGQALVVALLALITVLPEYAVDIYFAFQAGKSPGSQYTQFAAANMTGANRLLVGVAWPLMVMVHWWKSGERGIALGGSNRGEVIFLALSSAYAFVILYKGRIDLWDCAALIVIFGSYIWSASRRREVEPEEEEEVESGPSGALLALPRPIQTYAMGAMVVTAGVIVFLMAEPFAEALIGTGSALGINKFLLIQWLAPLASEAPTVTLAVLLVLAGNARTSLGMMLSDKINQWTLLVAMLPLAVSVGAGAISSLPLDARQQEEFFLTAAQSIFALTLLLGLRFNLPHAIALFSLFCLQVGLAFVYRNDEAQTILHLTQLAWLYVALAVAILIVRPRRILAFIRGREPH